MASSNKASWQAAAFGCGGIAIAGVLLFGYLFCFVSIGKGQVGVLSWFGDVEDRTLSPGPHLVHPLKTVYRMNTQT
jgi:hypothetical protein